MRNKIFIASIIILFISLSVSFALEKRTRIILLVSEQNIEGPQRAWWASEIDLSTTEARLASRLIQEGYEVIEPTSLEKIIRKDRAFRLVNITEPKSIRLANLSKADYVVLGKAIASAGARVPQSNMRSCFANISIKLIRVKDAKVVAYLDAVGNSAHMDVVSGGREALVNAAEDLAQKIIEALNKEKEGR
ncbi:MAG: hypothetical protein NC908_04015 [Candidatus Omnitrophica bacterium]|nr:hypothetical protein [Candidatus Omnitrophota bacterium]